MTSLRDVKWTLASASPRRLALLRQAGIEPEVCPADVDELNNGDPEATVLENARRKSRVVCEKVSAGFVLAADTEVVIDGTPVGKPANEQEAQAMLTRLAGTWHEVVTGFVLAFREEKHGAGWRVTEGVEKTRVRFRALHSREISEYIQECRPFDKAGGYGIQERAGMFVDRLEGCYFNVVGLPLARVMQEADRLYTSNRTD